MADNKDVYSANDPIEINELMSLNNDISNDFIEQLQNQISSGAQNGAAEDSALFEEPAADSGTANGEYEDAFIRKFNEKKRKRELGIVDTPSDVQTQEQAPETVDTGAVENTAAVQKEPAAQNQEQEIPAPAQTEQVETQLSSEAAVQDVPPHESNISDDTESSKNIDVVSGGNITETALDENFKDYKNNLDYADNNTKYSKYVVYIDPENQEFMDSLTVKERKNLINRIIREQDSFAVTKRKLKNMQSIITHIIIAILTVTISIPVIYFMINASLEATINNYKNSQTTFGQLYKTHSKIKPINN